MNTLNLIETSLQLSNKGMNVQKIIIETSLNNTFNRIKIHKDAIIQLNTIVDTLNAFQYDKNVMCNNSLEEKLVSFNKRELLLQSLPYISTKTDINSYFNTVINEMKNIQNTINDQIELEMVLYSNIWRHVRINIYSTRVNSYVNKTGTNYNIKWINDTIYNNIVNSIEYKLNIGNELISNNVYEERHFNRLKFLIRMKNIETYRMIKNASLYKTKIGEKKPIKFVKKVKQIKSIEEKPIKGIINVLKQDYTVIKCNNVILDIQNIPIRDRKIFHGERCSFTNIPGSLNVLERKYPKNIVCKVLITKKIIHKFNRKGFPYYVATPLKKNYPKCLVTLNNKIKDLNEKDQYYVIVDYSSWGAEIFPLSTLKRIIGKVGVESVEYDRILETYNIDKRKKKHRFNVKINQNTKLFDIVNYDSLIKHNYEDMTWLRNIVSIDPKDCKDIDDALSAHVDKKTKNLIFGIHIADVSFWVKFLKLEHFLKKQGFTVYKNVNDTKNRYNIFPDILSEFLFPLIKKKNRLAFSCFIETKEDKITKKRVIVNIQFKKTIIKTDHNISYEDADILLNKTKKQCSRKNKQLLTCLKRFKYFFHAQDSHSIVSKAMIKCNSSAGQVLLDNDTKGILRYSGGRIDNNSILNINCKKTNQFAKNYLSGERAEYIYTEDGELYNCQYCHFTSPIRRIVDIINHIEIKKVIDSNYNYNIDVNVNKINKWDKENKNIHWEIKFIDMLYNKIQTNKKYNSYIIKIVDNVITLYCSELELLFRKKIIHDRVNKDIIDLNYKNCDQIKQNYNLWESVDVSFVLPTTKIEYDVIITKH